MLPLSCHLAGGGAQAVTWALGSGCKYRRNFAHWPTAQFLLCSWVPNRPGAGDSCSIGYVKFIIFTLSLHHSSHSQLLLLIFSVMVHVSTEDQGPGVISDIFLFPFNICINLLWPMSSRPTLFLTYVYVIFWSFIMSINICMKYQHSYWYLFFHFLISDLLYKLQEKIINLIDSKEYNTVITYQILAYYNITPILKFHTYMKLLFL